MDNLSSPPGYGCRYSAWTMFLPTPTTLGEFEERVSLYRSGSNAPAVLVFALWLGGIIIASIYEETLFGNDETLTVRFLGGALVTALIVMWPLIPIKTYCRWRSQKLGLVCPCCNDTLMYKPNWFRHIRESRTCPTCGTDLFPEETSAE